MAEKEYIERGKAFENEYISRREAIKARKRSCNKNCLECDFAIEGDSWCNGEVFVVDLLRIPAADVRPAVRGKWDMYQDGSGVCSVCGKAQFQHWEDGKPDKFCHNCGAAMEES